MTISKEQLQKIADMLDLKITEDVMHVGTEIIIFDEDKQSFIREKDESVTFATELRGDPIEPFSPHISVSDEGDKQHINIRAMSATRYIMRGMGLDNPTVRFIPEESNKEGSNIPPEGVIFFEGEGMRRIVEMNKEGKIKVRGDNIPKELEY